MNSIRNKLMFAGSGCLTLALAQTAVAAEPTGDDSNAEGGGKVTLVGGTDGASAAGEGPNASGRWIRKYRPRAHDLELGIFAGAFFPDPEMELRDPSATIEDWDQVAPSIGARLGYYPLRHFGLEGEFAAIPTRNGGESAFVYSARAQGVIQPGFWRITPFALLGGGVIGVASGSDVVGNEADQALHVGGGLKLLINDRVQLRLEGRDVISPRLGTTERPAHSPEALFTVAFRFGLAPKPAPAEPPPPDRDEDGMADDVDHCPWDAGPASYEGCPIPDSDCDGMNDEADQCPQAAASTDDGCPLADRDGDGILDEADKCPDEAGQEPDGCPLKDSDNDGILDRKDKCPNEPETANGFDDLDGCPDEVPKEVEKFTGVIQGIFFDTGKDTIKPTSESVLDNAAKVLVKYNELKVEIVGHTDDRGNHDSNVDLSKRRAESVKTYLVSKGVGADRVQTRGAGPDEPMADNKTKAGRAKNRRIEFKLVR